MISLSEKGLTPWEQYLQKKKERRKEMKKKRAGKEVAGKGDQKSPDIVSKGFDDPFFQHSVTTATAVSISSCQEMRIYNSPLSLFLSLLSISLRPLQNLKKGKESTNWMRPSRRRRLKKAAN